MAKGKKAQKAAPAPAEKVQQRVEAQEQTNLKNK